MSAELERKVAADIGLRFQRMIEESVAVMEVVDRTFTLMRDPKTGELKHHPDMPEEEWNIHLDAMKPLKSVPFYLRCHQERVALAHRISGDRATAPAQIAKYVVRALGTPPIKYPVVDVEVKEK